MGEHPEKPMCRKGEEGEHCEDMPEKPDCEEEDCEDMEHPEKPDMGEGESMGTIVVGDEGKWQKCAAELEEMDINGEAKCEDVICHVMCMDGFVVDGALKAKCEKGKNGKWAFNKPLGVCVPGEGEDKRMCEEGEDCEDMPDKPDCEEDEECEGKPEKPMCEDDEDCEDMPEKPEHDEDMPDVFGDEGKWTKCEPEPVDNGKLHCMDVKCMLYCMDGFMVEGNAKAKCEKKKNGKWKFNKAFGTCVECD